MLNFFSLKKLSMCRSPIYIIDHMNFWPPFPRGATKKFRTKCAFHLTQTVGSQRKRWKINITICAMLHKKVFKCLSRCHIKRQMWHTGFTKVSLEIILCTITYHTKSMTTTKALRDLLVWHRTHMRHVLPFSIERSFQKQTVHEICG